MPQRREELRRMFRHFGRALSEAISESPDATRSLRRLREEGCELYLLLGATGEIRARTPLSVSPGNTAPGDERGPDALPPAPFEATGGAGIEWQLGEPASADDSRPETGAAAGRKPGFRIDASDLAFLRSIGIDPTRRAPRRRKG